MWVAPKARACSLFERHRIDGEDAVGAGELGPLNGVDADAADADDGDVVTRTRPPAA